MWKLTVHVDRRPYHGVTFKEKLGNYEAYKPLPGLGGKRSCQSLGKWELEPTAAFARDMYDVSKVHTCIPVTTSISEPLGLIRSLFAPALPLPEPGCSCKLGLPWHQ